MIHKGKCKQVSCHDRGFIGILHFLAIQRVQFTGAHHRLESESVVVFASQSVCMDWNNLVHLCKTWNGFVDLHKEMGYVKTIPSQHRGLAQVARVMINSESRWGWNP